MTTIKEQIGNLILGALAICFFIFSMNTLKSDIDVPVSGVIADRLVFPPRYKHDAEYKLLFELDDFDCTLILPVNENDFANNRKGKKVTFYLGYRDFEDTECFRNAKRIYGLKQETTQNTWIVSSVFTAFFLMASIFIKNLFK